MSFVVKNAIIHSITKKQNVTVVEKIVKKTRLLDVQNAAVISLVEGVNGLLGKPGNTLSYGQFGNDMREGQFPSKFGNYLPLEAQDAEFLKISHCALSELADQAAQKSGSTGGHILVSSYESEGKPFFLVAMIKQRGGIVLDDDYVPQEIVEVDLSKVHQAARINISRYLEVMSLPSATESDDEVPEDRTYLAFLGVRGDNQAAGYFLLALGCTKGVGSSRATINVVTAVVDFFSRPELRNHLQDARSAVSTYLYSKLDSGQDAVLSEIAYCVTGVLKSRQEEFIEEFKVYLNSENAKVPAAFPVHGATLRKSTRIKAENKNNWTIQFERRLLGRTPNSTIYFDEKRKSLTFNGIDDATVSEITAELALRTQ